jgi:uncharacterized membrane protein YfcA
MPYQSSWIYPVFFVTGLIAGWVDSIAGGGGLITIPVLLASGLPPQAALGTNKFQASFGSFTAAWYYADRGVVPLADVRLGVAMTLAGAVAGTLAVQRIPPELLGLIIPFLLLAIALYMLFSPSAGIHERPSRWGRRPFYVVFGLGLGFYDGFFGPGVGSFWAVAFVAVMGFKLIRATGYTKVMNFTSNLVSFLVFLAGGQVVFGAAISMAAGQTLGALLGSRMVVSRGASIIRPILIGVVILTTLKLLYNRFFPGS